MRNQLGFELRHLVALDAVARHRSFNAAADELGYTQSAVSQQIVGLEQLVGTRLFERSRGPGPIRLTEPGRVLLRHAEALLARVDAASADMTALVDGIVGELRIGTYQSVATRLLPAILARLRARWPRVEVELFESGSHDEIDARVERGALDLAFSTPPLPNEDVAEYLELLRDPYVLVVAADHPLADPAAPAPSLAELGEYDLVGYRTCRAHAQVERWMRSQGVEPRIAMRAEDNNLLQGLAAQGMGVAIMPLLAIDRDRQDTVIIDIGGVLPARQIGLLWHVDRPHTAAAESFIEISQEVSRELAAEWASEDLRLTAA
jgi:DNA-binding transcriptional LysR family regulator